MLFKLKKIKKNGFTMLELIFVCVVFAMLISGIILAINRTYIFMNNTKVQIRATNLAREGMEMMFNIRDTNRRKCSGQKDKFWLYIGSGANSETNCEPGDSKFKKGIYIIKEGRINGSSTGDKFIYAERLNEITTAMETGFYEDYDKFFSDTDDTYKGAREKAKLTFTGTYSYWSGSADTGAIATGEMVDLLGNGVEFYRIARVYGVYCKDKENPNEEIGGRGCPNDSEPKEMRFCVKVFYKLGVGNHSSELCSIMTNFME